MQYENEQDRKNEEAVIKEIARRYGCDYRKLPVRYVVDYGLFRGRDLAYFAEVKCRKIPRHQFPDLILSLFKFGALLDLQSTHSIPALLVACWTDSMGITRVPLSGMRIGWGGRTDRADDQDTEPVVYIPVDHFSKMQRPREEIDERTDEAEGDGQADRSADPEGREA
jgi:hypothetical protein